MYKFILFFLFIFLIHNTAYAYIDPGTGSIIIQAIVGAFAAGGIFLKKYWYKLKNFFKKKNKN